MSQPLAGWRSRVGRKLTIWDLHILHACVQQGSISAAAKTLGMGKPTLSKILSGIEREFGTALLVRSSRGVQPTEAGRALMTRSGAALDELHTAVGAIRDLLGSRSGELRIAANEVALWSLVGPVISRLHDRYPGIVFEIVPAYTRAAQLQELERGNVELVVGQVVETDHHLDVTHLFQDKLIVAAGPRSRWAARERIDLAELVDEPWAFSPLASVSGRTMAQAFHDAGLPLPHIATVAPSMQLLRRLVTGGDYLALFPQSVVRRWPDVAVLPVTFDAFWQPIGVLAVKHRTLSPLATVFIEGARLEVARQAGAAR